jgi:predicted AlkP superfamily pyrophosphatase or phosphodiesterase
LNKTILVIIDGCRSDGLEQAKTPNIDYMIENGTHTLNARTVTPSITLPAHFSIFTSLPPIAHNVLTNTGSPQPSSIARSIIDVAKDYGKKTAFLLPRLLFYLSRRNRYCRTQIRVHVNGVP